ncbi:tetraacyldisaccharide 4'-kinase [Trichlorobacter lovleyi]|uniref:tetraacyldisaccharide 4'-kinase n=1 Tax=Trichlorobacter lovleyi TaxID=313985 RepID=UPI0038B5B2D9
MTGAVWWRGMADGSNRSAAAFALKLLLAPFALLYGTALCIRALLYQAGILATHRLPCPVISVGNLTVGGTGKTPVTILLARELQHRGCRVAVLSRGYGGSLEGQVAVVSDGESLLLGPGQAGDEPCLLARSVAGLIVVIGSDRYQAGLTVLERFRPDVLLLDDGFQHIRLYRDLNILLLDAARPFGNGWTVPLGLLREPRTALKRADLALFTRCHGTEMLPPLTLPTSRSYHRLASFQLLVTGNAVSLEQLQQGRVAAFAGIAEPSAFFEALRQIGIEPVATLSLPDHEPYHAAGLQQLEALVASAEPDWLITTEKDGIKLQGEGYAWSSRLVTARLEVQLEDRELLARALDKLFQIGPE